MHLSVAIAKGLKGSGESCCCVPTLCGLLTQCTLYMHVRTSTLNTRGKVTLWALVGGSGGLYLAVLIHRLPQLQQQSGARGGCSFDLGVTCVLFAGVVF